MLTLSIIQYVGLLGLSTVSGVLAAPNVTAVPLAGGCSVYPMWEYRGIVNQTGPFQLRLISTDNPSANGVVSVVEVQRRTAMQVQWGTITYSNATMDDRTWLRCINGTMQAYAPVNWPDQAWVNIAIESQQSQMGYFVWNTTPIAPFAHYVDGVKQDGVFVGAAGHNSTTWAFTYRPARESTHGRDFFHARLLGLNNATLSPGDFTGFIRADWPS